ncbi:uncharacterized protein Fot_15807 [Forsythia ovata]|uniref:Uncharacterized protein n=1 Tax=Forsythia ovata TaxID=205694 RepID=A0ABD1WAA0_9LAMI
MEDTVTDIKDLVFSENEEKGNVEEQSSTGGLVNNFISNLISPKSSPRVMVDCKEKCDDFGFKDESGEDLGGGGGDDAGGIVKNLVASIFHQSEGGGGEEKDNEEEKVQEKGGGVIDSLVSHLPTPLADDAAPTTDEATMLIHSIVHD